MEHKVQLQINFPIAFDSPDHLYPWETSRDNSNNLRFNAKTEKLFSLFCRPTKILDLGCSGGAFVKSCLDEGSFAIGLEGRDYSKKFRRAEWPILEDRFLFTCDINREFQILLEGQPLTFHIITSWMVMEHVLEERLKQTCTNIKQALEPHGLVILSVRALRRRLCAA